MFQNGSKPKEDQKYFLCLMSYVLNHNNKNSANIRNQIYHFHFRCDVVLTAMVFVIQEKYIKQQILYSILTHMIHQYSLITLIPDFPLCIVLTSYRGLCTSLRSETLGHLHGNRKQCRFFFSKTSLAELTE